MNLREGTRRLALLLGVVGVILGAFASYVELQTVLNQRALHNKFEQLANSDVVQQERKRLQAEPNDWQTISPQIDPKTGERVTPQIDPKTGESVPKQVDYNGWEVTVNKGGIGTIYWGKNLAIASIETDDGQRLYPTPAPALWSYLLIAILPVLGFFVPWGAIRAVGWVGAGFVASQK